MMTAGEADVKRRVLVMSALPGSGCQSVGWRQPGSTPALAAPSAYPDQCRRLPLSRAPFLSDGFPVADTARHLRLSGARTRQGRHADENEAGVRADEMTLAWTVVRLLIVVVPASGNHESMNRVKKP
jgi:hypothetical protein